MRNVFISSIAIAGASLFTSAIAQTVEASSGADIIQPLTVNIVTNVDFGIIAPDTEADGTVRVYGSNQQCSSNLTCLGGSHSGIFIVTGEPNQAIVIHQPQPITLTGPNGATMYVDQFHGSGGGPNSWGSNRVLPANGQINASNWINPLLHVAANQEPGVYSGSFVLAAEYQ